MKILLKFVVLGAWVLFGVALWHNRQAASGTPVHSLPSLGLLSISRKLNEAQSTVRPLSAQPSITWPERELIIAIPQLAD